MEWRVAKHNCFVVGSVALASGCRANTTKTNNAFPTTPEETGLKSRLP